MLFTTLYDANDDDDDDDNGGDSGGGVGVVGWWWCGGGGDKSNDDECRLLEHPLVHMFICAYIWQSLCQKGQRKKAIEEKPRTLCINHEHSK